MASASNAEWVKVSESKLGTSYYVDNKSIMAQDTNFYIKMLVNYAQKQSTGELSSISDTMINCRNQMLKETHARYYSKRFGKGKKIGDDDLVRYDMAFWRSNVPGSVEFLFVSRLCGALEK